MKNTPAMDKPRFGSSLFTLDPIPASQIRATVMATVPKSNGLTRPTLSKMNKMKIKSRSRVNVGVEKDIKVRTSGRAYTVINTCHKEVLLRISNTKRVVHSRLVVTYDINSKIDLA